LSILQSVVAAVSTARLKRLPLRQRPLQRTASFTLVELVVVIAIILILVGLVLTTVGYVQKKGARSRAETEIAALSAALESYKADNGIYPRDATTTDVLNANNGDPTFNGDPTSPGYQQASQYLYGQLSGDRDFNTVIDSTEQANRTYFTFKPNMLSTPPPTSSPTPTPTVNFIRDPFGNSYGYSTIQAATPGSTSGYNPTFDLWSTAGLTDPPTATITPQWIKNW
jgi:type II secretory pathway pseudopilin PulG